MAVILVPILVSIAVLVAILGLRSMLFPNRQRVVDRLQDAQGMTDAVGDMGPSLTEQPLPPFWRGLSLLGWTLPGMVQSESLQWDLAQAGYRRREAAGLFVGAKVVLAFLFGVLGFSVGVAMLLPRTQLTLATLGAAVLGFFVPNIWLGRRQAKRTEAITLTLPDSLDLMVVCVEAGQGLNSALLTVGDEMGSHAPELSSELRLINREIRAGLPRAQALRNFADRTGVTEARALVAVLVQSDRLGTSIAQALRVHADSMRVRRRQRAEEAARKTAVKMLFPLIFCIFPELMVVILAPGMIQLLRVLADSTSPS